MSDPTRQVMRRILTEQDGPVGERLAMFHVTPTANVPNIIQCGLIPVGEKDERIYLFRTEDEAWDGLTNWISQKYEEDEKYALLAVQVSPAMIQEDPELPGNAVYTTTAIGPQGIQVAIADFLRGT